MFSFDKMSFKSEINWRNLQFYKNLSAGLKDIVWRTIDEEKEEGQPEISG